MSVGILVPADALTANCVGASVSGRTDASDGKPSTWLDAQPSVPTTSTISARVGSAAIYDMARRLTIRYLPRISAHLRAESPARRGIGS
jgi:hypothetical protein